jgi:pimeloyl-ACP methyl ester carboxylesterase
MAPRRWIPLLALAVGLASVGWYTRHDPERRTLDASARRAAPGRFVRLADGVTHYEVSGPDSGAVVLLAAPFSVPGWIWDPLVQQLADAGFRAIRFDYYGRGWSDRLDTTYDQDLFVRQMAGVLDALSLVGPVALAGVSYGAAMATSFADRHPERVRALVYLNPVFNNRRPLPPEERSALAWNIHMVLRGGSDEMAASQAEDFLHPERFPHWVARYRVQQQFRGTREAWRRTRVAIAAAPDQAEQLARVGSHERPVLVLWGANDRYMPLAASAAVMASLPNATLVPVDSAAHLPHVEQPELVGRAVVDFLRSVARRR